jgi:flagellar biosynthesis chaperone FliJ
MNLLDHAQHAVSTIEQLTTRIDELAAELTTVRQQFAELSAYKDAMETQVSTVLQSGDPAQYEALARDFLTPAEEKARQEKIARVEALKAEAAALEAELAK